MPAAMAMTVAAGMMPATPMPTTAAVAASMTAFRHGISGGRQHGRENDDDKLECEFRLSEFQHGTDPGAARTRGLFENTGLAIWFP